MRRACLFTLALGLLLGHSSVRADDQAEAVKIIDKAIKAAGDESKQQKLQASTFKMKGTFHGMGAEIPYTGDAAIQLPDKSRMTLEFDANCQKFTFLMVFAGDKGWMKIMDMIIEMDDDRIAEQKESMHLHKVARLIGLKDKAYTLAPLGESKVEQQTVVGVRVSRQGQRDINLFFDKETGLLAKSETRVKDESGQEANQETLYKDYKISEGIKYPMKITIKRDGMLYIDGENLDWKPVEKLDEGLFKEPKGS